MQTIEFSVSAISGRYMLRTTGFEIPETDGVAECHRNAQFKHVKFYKASKKGFQTLQDSGKYHFNQTF